jgi:hypothetical protein
MDVYPDEIRRLLDAQEEPADVVVDGRPDRCAR